MKVLMLSLDKTLLGEQIKDRYGMQGDTVYRHKKYAEFLEELNIIVTSPPGYKHISFADNLHVYPTNSKTVFGHFVSSARYAESFYSHMSLDLVVAQDLMAPAAYFISRRFNVPYIVSMHSKGFDAEDWKKGINFIFMPFIKYFIKKADKIRVTSNSVKRRLHTEENIDNKKIEVIPTAVNLDIFYNFKDKKQTDTLRKKYGADFIILMDNRLEKVKDIETALKAFKELTKYCHSRVKNKHCKIKFLIIGTGSMKKALIKKVEEYGLKSSVVFVGNVEFERLPVYYHASDLFVLSSVEESLGKVVLQACASGIPVVATKTDGVKSIIKNKKTGFLVDIGSWRQIFNRIKYLLSNEKIMKEIGENAREYVFDNYSSQENIEKIIELWKDTVRKL